MKHWYYQLKMFKNISCVGAVVKGGWGRGLGYVGIGDVGCREAETWDAGTRKQRHNFFPSFLVYRGELFSCSQGLVA